MKLTVQPPEQLSGESEEEQVFLQNLATEFISMLEDTERAMAKKFADQMFDPDEGSAFWSLVPAKVKTAIKRGGAAPGEICAECKLTGTHMRHCSIGGRFA